MIKVLAAAVIAVHGFIHTIGFVVPWRLAVVDGFPFRTTVLGGALTLGDAGARFVGVAWLAVGIGFVVAAVAVARGHSWATPLLVCLSVASGVLCLLGLPEAGAGVVVNVAIAAVIAYQRVGSSRVPGLAR